MCGHITLPCEWAVFREDGWPICGREGTLITYPRGSHILCPEHEKEMTALRASQGNGKSQEGQGE